MERYICIHGHFYQPPRENPWLETIELQDSAFPYHDWNERVTAECYGPNAASRILDGEGRIARIVNNYARISFNFGPTVLAWMQARAPRVYEAIQQADRDSRALFGGHGSAMAQVYNHMIMPLANRRDRVTQVRWGLADFRSRFGRDPEGMWLAETAVDYETLDILAEHGIEFTLLAPRQAARIRDLDGGDWVDVGEAVDPTRPYLCRLPSGRSIALFFYDGPVSQAVAFERLLERGEHLASRLMGAFSDERSWPQLVHIATDGETYGHHHRQGDMALAYALQHIEQTDWVTLTNYGQYLEKHPPTTEVQIVENSSWSCIHGIERWRASCGCNSGGHGGWNQNWRAPLRQALDWLRDTLAPLYEREAGKLVARPWAARDAYIDVVLDRSDDSLGRFFEAHATGHLEPNERVRLLELLELQRHAMLMYTSCGWFFDELSGIETVQSIQYAGRAVQLAARLLDEDPTEGFLEQLQAAKSNLPHARDGRAIYERYVRPAMVDLPKVGAHYAVSSVFDTYDDIARIYCYSVDRKDYQVLDAGRSRMVVGRVTVTSEITRQTADLTFGVLHFADHNMSGGVREFIGDTEYRQLVREATAAFDRADFGEILCIIQKHFGGSSYSLRSLFRDEQRRIVKQIMSATLGALESEYRRIYDNHAPLMRFVAALGMPLPKALEMPAEFVLNAAVVEALEAEPPDLERVQALLDELQSENVEVDRQRVEYALRKRVEGLMGQLTMDSADLGLLERVEALVAFARGVGFEVNLRHTQDLFYGLLESELPARAEQAAEGEARARQWIDRVRHLGELLSVAVP